MPLFDSYVMVDWSAASIPRSGADSIWIACLDRGARGPLLENPPTRAAAARRLADLLAERAAQGGRVLAGFDFPHGYPAGFAGRLAPDRPDWQGVWAAVAARLRDGADNANDRFAAAAAINLAVSGGAAPFWGHPWRRSWPGLPARLGGNRPFAETRLAERRARGTQSAWKLYGAGSVGGQALTGIARLHGLRLDPRLAGRVGVWPFETGLRPLAPPAPGAVVLAEIWPSLFPRDPHPVRDAGQVTATVRHFAASDETAALADLFAGDPGLTAAERAAVEREEGWILGVTGPLATRRRVRRPAS